MEEKAHLSPIGNQILNQLPRQSVFIFDENMNYVLAKGQGFSSLEIEEEDLLGCNFFEVWPSEVAHGFAPFLSEALKGRAGRMEQKVGGRFESYEFVPLANQSGAVEKVMMLVQNISSLNLYKEALQNSGRIGENQNPILNSVINAVSDVILICNRQGELLYTNEAACSFFSLEINETKAAVMAANVSFLSAKTQMPLQPHELPVNMALRGMEVSNYEFYLFNKRTQIGRFVEASTKSIKSSDGQIESAAMVLRDINTRKEQEVYLEQNLTTLKTSNTEFKQLFTWVNEELREPSANLTMLVNLLKTTDREEDRSEIIQHLSKTSQQLMHSVENLSKLYMFKIGEATVKQECDFEQYLKNSITKIQQSISFHNIDLNINFEAKQSVLANPGVLFNTFFELLTNAIRFRKPNTRLEINIETWQEGEKTLLAIADNGQGISAENQTELFSLFSTFSKNSGKGIGLFVLKGQLKQEGGFLQAESEEGFGSRFIVTF